MMKFSLPLLSRRRGQDPQKPGTDDLGPAYKSSVWKSSKVAPGVRYAVRKVSLGQRIALVKKTRDLALQNEFLRAGEVPDQMSAALSELYIQRLYLEWGFLEVKGLTIDGQTPTVSLLIEQGPEILCSEIAEAIQRELSLNEDERKNS